MCVSPLMDYLTVARGLYRCGKQAWLLCGMWDLTSLTKDQSISPALGGRFLTTGPPGKSLAGFSYSALQLPKLGRFGPDIPQNTPSWKLNASLEGVKAHELALPPPNCRNGRSSAATNSTGQSQRVHTLPISAQEISLLADLEHTPGRGARAHRVQRTAGKAARRTRETCSVLHEALLRGRGDARGGMRWSLLTWSTTIQQGDG